MMFARRLQILPDGEEIDFGGPQIIHHLQDFITLFAKANHNSGFGEDFGIDFLDALR